MSERELIFGQKIEAKNEKKATLKAESAFTSEIKKFHKQRPIQPLNGPFDHCWPNFFCPKISSLSDIFAQIRE